MAFDGTGYGTDGRIRGSEFLVCDYAGFERRAHFRYVPLAGGDTAVRQTWRSALAYLRDADLDTGFLAEQLPSDAFRVVGTMLAKGLNTVETSSCGRLFDAVAAIAGVRLEASYEGQGAMELKALAVRAGLDVEHAYPFDVANGIVDFRETIRSAVLDRDQPALVAGRFHNTLVLVIAETCRRLAASDRLSRVCLSGGAFQNFYLLERAAGLLRKKGLDVYLHARVPPNDGGLCLGQAMAAHSRALSC